MATAVAMLFVLMGDDCIQPRCHVGGGIELGAFVAIILSEQLEVEQAGFHDQPAVGRIIPAIGAEGMEGRPRDAAIIIGHADPILITQYRQVRPMRCGDGQVKIGGIPLGEIPGMRQAVGPHAPLRRRCADHRRLARKNRGCDGAGFASRQRFHAPRPIASR